MKNINSWNDIQWRDIENKVFRLQLRIFKAAAKQELKKTYKLQKLLISSYSAKYLSVQRVTQENAGKKPPGIDIILTPSERFALANQLSIDGKRSTIKRVYLPSADGKKHPLGIPRIKDRAKQMLAYLAMCPQWEAQFEADSYGFRPGRSGQDAIEAVFFGIVNNSKWVLDANISKCLDKINHQYIIKKCNTFPEMEKQIRVWLKAGILESKEYTDIITLKGDIISPLLNNIILHGLRKSLDSHINTLKGHHPNNKQALTYIRYADQFVLMYPDKEILEELKDVVQQFLEPIGLELDPIKTRIVHSLNATQHSSPGFTFLGFDIIQRQIRRRKRKVTTKKGSTQNVITLITPSKKDIRKHKLKIRDIIRRYRGTSQEILIQKLNPMILEWANFKRSQVASKIFQDLDAYLCYHLWKWARKRHPKMSKVKLKEKYWHRVENRNWVFGVKTKTNESVFTQIQLHSKIPIKRHVKVKGKASPFDGNLVYWANRTSHSVLISSSQIQTRLIY